MTIRVDSMPRTVVLPPLPKLGLAFLLLAACAGSPVVPIPDAPPVERSDAPVPRERSLDGLWRFAPAALRPADAYRPETPDADWETIPVPANWYPVRGELAGAAWYRRTFPAVSPSPDSSPDSPSDSPPDPPSDSIARLVFHGVDYAADVWLNGRYLGFHEGRFAPFAFDATDALRSDGENLLAVRVDSPHEPPGRVWSLRKRLVKGVFSHHDTRPGGAWSERGQDGNTGGIWAPVRLRFSESAAIVDLRVRQRLDLESRTAAPEVEIELYRPPGRPETGIRIAVELRPDETPPSMDSTVATAETRVRVGPGTTVARLRLPETPVRLWSTRDTGTPHLYRLEARIHPDTDTAGATPRGCPDPPRGCPAPRTAVPPLLDRAERIIGFREIAVDPETFVVRLNGRRLFLRGTNYISAQWVSEMDAAAFDRDLEFMEAAHINAIRVHAHVEPAAFYEACDRRGILVWQDFPLQWGYDDGPELRKEAVRQAGEMVAMLDRHPSIFAWCAHNEPPWEADWMRYKYPDYEPGQNRALDEAVAEALRRADPERYVHLASTGEEHPWFGWYSGSWKDYRKPAGHPLVTEFGAQALPDLDVLRGIVGDEALWPRTEAHWNLWEYRNFQRRETFELAGIPRGETIAELIRNTQTYQARLIRTAAESYRRQRFSPVAGIFQFLFSENWPSMNWGMMDHLRNPKPGYRALQTAYQPVLPCADMTPESWRPGEASLVDLWVVNDRHEAYPDAVLRYAWTDGRRDLGAGEIRLSVAPDHARKIETLRWTGPEPGAYELRLRLEDADGVLLGANRYPFHIGGDATPPYHRGAGGGATPPYHLGAGGGATPPYHLGAGEDAP